MGCASSSSADNSKPSAQNGKGGGGGGAKAGGLDDDAAAPKQNPYITLTHREIFQLKMSWKAIRRALVETGVNMFIFMFEASPDTKTYFEKFKDVPNDVLAKKEPFKDFANNVLEFMDTCVTELDEAEKTQKNLLAMGAKHKAKHIPITLFKEMKLPFLKAVEETLGDRYSDRMRVIYEVLIDYFVKTMEEGYEK